MEDTNYEKMDSEISKDQQTERAEDSGPIQIGAATPEEKAMKEQKIVDDLMALFGDWETARKTREITWHEIYRLYFTTPEQRKTQTRSNITVPIIYQIIEAGIPKIANVLFTYGQEFFDVKPMGFDQDSTSDKALNIKQNRI